MILPDRIQLGPLIGLTVLVCAAGALVAGLFGIAAGQMYVQGDANLWGDPAPGIIALGGRWGAVTGVLAGLFWTGVMVAFARRCADNRLHRIGALAGLAAGVLSTLLLHAALMYRTGDHEWSNLQVGLFCGIPDGLLVGAIFGKAWGGILRRTQEDARGVTREGGGSGDVP